MLDDRDIQKLIKAQKEIFVTKDEFEGLIEIVATKEELRNELQKTQKEILKAIGKRFDSVDEKLKEVNRLETRIDYIENVLAIKKA